jgi:hypothetical protein
MQSQPEIGTSLVTGALMAEVTKGPKDNPPKQFDLARKERVFNSQIQYVEFALKNYQLSRNIASVPPDLMGLANNKELQGRWHNSYRVFDGLMKMTVKIQDVDHEGSPRKDQEGKLIEIEYGEEHIEKEKKTIIFSYSITLEPLSFVHGAQSLKEPSANSVTG